MSISEDQLAIDWTLTPSEKEFVVNNSRGMDSRICFAGDLCSLRAHSCFIDKKRLPPISVFNYLASQLGYPYMTHSDSLVIFLSKDRSSIRGKISSFLGYRTFDDSEQRELQSWLDRALREEIYERSVIAEKAKKYLSSRKIIIPSPSKMGRLLSKVIKESYEELYQSIICGLPPSSLENLKILLLTDNENMLVKLGDLKKSPAAPTARVINEYLGYYHYLQEIGIFDIKINVDTPVIKYLSQICRYSTLYDLRRIQSSNKRYTIVICFLHESSRNILDLLVQMHGQLLNTVKRKSINAVRQERISIAKQSRSLFATAGEFIRGALSKDNESEKLIDFLKGFDSDILLESATACENLSNIDSKGFVKKVSSRYGYLRRYSKDFLKLHFEASSTIKPFLESIETLRQYHSGAIKKLPKDVSTKFFPKVWKDASFDANGNVDPKHWEIGVYFTIKKLLSSGDLYLSDSYNHRYFWDTVCGDEEDRIDVISNSSGLYIDFDTIESDLREQFDSVAKKASTELPNNSFAKIENEKLVLSKDDALYISPEVKKLRKLIRSSLPMVRIEQLLAEVDKISKFTSALVPLESINGSAPKKAIYAAIIAHGTNIGLYGMGHSAVGLSTEMIKNASQNYIRPETISKASNMTISRHLEYPISKVFGDGTWSSSDGQRYGIESSSIFSSYYPRYFGYYDKAISIYTHISDSFDVFSTKVISCSEREATYVLSGLLSNETKMDIEFHCTDTHGFTEHIFALCFLLGFSFHPRIKDLKEQRIYKIPSSTIYGDLDSIFAGNAEMELIKNNKDEILRIASAFKSGHIAAHVIIQKLANRSDSLSRALRALGRIVKSIYILRYISDEKLRYKVHLQLNRGESRHNLAKSLFFVNRGVFKTNDYEEIMSKASCLSLLSNLVLLWNCHHIERIVASLRKNGEVLDKDLEKISPLTFRHIQIHGTYHFDNL